MTTPATAESSSGPCRVPDRGSDESPPKSQTRQFIRDLSSPSSTSSPAPTTVAPLRQHTGAPRRTTAEAPGSPPKLSSPLRNAISCDHVDPARTPIQAPRSRRHIANPTVTSSGSPKMVLTGDRRAAKGQESPSLSDTSSPTTPHSQTTPIITTTCSTGPKGPLGLSQTITPQGFQSRTRQPSTEKGSAPSTVIKSLQTKQLPSLPSVAQDQELVVMDITKALYPFDSFSSPADNQNTFSPAAFKNLQMTAVGLLTKFQTAYSQKVQDVHQLQDENCELAEQLEVTDTQVRHLKMQLEAMARKASEQESIMQSLMEDLNREKVLRLQQQEEALSMGTTRAIASSSSSLCEDLGAEQDQKAQAWRRSGATVRSNTSFDTDEESVEEISVFSRSRSPTIVTTVSESSIVETPAPPPVPPKQPQPGPTATSTAMLSRPPSKTSSVTPSSSTPTAASPQLTAFQKLWKGMSPQSSQQGRVTRTVTACGNCQGQDASVAWDTVSLLRDENKDLKHRVEGLEAAVEEALDAVNGLSLEL